jgi:glycerate 2-kinase
MKPERLLSTSLRAAPWGGAMARIMAAAMAAADPAVAVGRYLRRDGDTLVIGEQQYLLNDVQQIYLLSVGKAAEAMARAVAALLGDRLAAGIVVLKEGPVAPLERCTVLVSGHPLPDERSVEAGQQVAALLDRAGADDLVLVLISGGGSALLCLPAPGLALADLQSLTGSLLASGAPINAINCLRKHLDLVKGGGLARMAAPARIATLILSDVVGSPLDVIASGPTVPDPTSYADAWAIVQQYGLAEQLPDAVRKRLEAGLLGQIADTPKPGDELFAGVQNLLVGSNQQAAAAAVAAARAEGFNAMLLTSYLQGEARVVGGVLAAIAREIMQSGNPLPRPACIVLGGETTVTLRGTGVGGRNQELALAAIAELAGLPNVAVIGLATDGGDGPTDAAGAVATGESLQRALALGRDPAAALANNDAYPFFAALGDLLLPGPSGTNVNDLAFVVVW